jgi:general secretion pathway protein B
MSYILDALKKAEQERQIGQVPGIASQHERTSVVGGGRWAWILLAVLLINAALLSYALWPDSGSSERDSGAPASAMPPVAGPPRIALAEPPDPPAVPTATRPAVEPVTAVPEAVASPRNPPAVQPPLRELPPQPAPVPEPETLRLLPPLAARPEATAPQSAPAGPPPDRAAVQGANLPVWPRIPGHLFSQLNGELRLDVHVYSEQPQERFVLINMLKYGEGDQLQEGPLVDAITYDGVILSFRGQRFQMRSQ